MTRTTGEQTETSRHLLGKPVRRRRFLKQSAGAAAGVLACAGMSVPAAAAEKTWRVAVIGHTGRGNYGHGLDRVWLDIPQAKVVAVADADPQGLSAAMKRLQAAEGFEDYRKMLEATRPEIVSVGPRWLDQHCDMVVAAAQGGVRGIYLEKPMCRTLEEADRMVEICQRHGVKLAIAHQTHYSPRLAVVRQLIEDGKIGRVLELQGRGKEDSRGGGEDLWVLGSHVMDLIHVLGGKPQWCFASVTEKGRPICKADVRPGNEGIGPLAGDAVESMYRLESGAHAWFHSTRGAGARPTRFGLKIFGSKGIIEIYTGYLPAASLLPDPAWSPGRTRAKWLPITSTGVDRPEPLSNGGLHAGNVLAVSDLIDAIVADRQPKSNIYDARVATEMIVAAFESQRVGQPVAIPLENRQNPLTMLAS